MERFLKFSQEPESDNLKSQDKWKILIVDDEEDVHKITKIILKDIKLDGKGLEIISAYSKKEAMKILKENQDIAVAVIDVVMEDKSAGLDLVKYIREELKNHKIRLIIRTGQPGYAPRKDVIMNYDINDYREKTELSSEMMVGVILAAIRSYRDISFFEREKEINRILYEFALEHSRKGLIRDNMMIALSPFVELFKRWGVGVSGSIKSVDGRVTEFGENPPEGIEISGEKGVEWVDSNTLRISTTAMGKPVATIMIRFSESLGERLRDSLRVSFLQLLSAVENEELKKLFESTMYKMIQTLADLIEHRSEETGEHVKRVSEMTKVLARKFINDEDRIRMIELASMLHDVGKIGIPDNVLNKPDRLTESEFEIMKKHTTIGYEILSKYDNEIFKIAATIARWHHENWDGSGYPDGLKGEEIPIEARIVSIVDTYDALRSDRVYRKAWSEEETLEYLKKMSGIKFDPKIVEEFFNSYEILRSVREKF